MQARNLWGIALAAALLLAVLPNSGNMAVAQEPETTEVVCPKCGHKFVPPEKKAEQPKQPEQKKPEHPEHPK
ncbi:MAG: hypothetical protein HYV35_02220 [Lentisphaerae bacterium]|nr:hypothetical protein [Lentisphaerota bacterium]